ncbi:hypothetical protein OIU76_009081 [Salix suchowensis]|nr:hypothetical protein OIU76_009081 [Salix suchowensis]
MAAAVIKEAKPISSASEIEFAKCDCCGFSEECTPAYISRVRESTRNFVSNLDLLHLQGTLPRN